MALIKQTALHQVDVVGPYKNLHCVYVSQIVDDQTGEEMSPPAKDIRSYAPGSDISGEAAEVQATANIWWTQEVLDAYSAHRASMVETGPE